MVKTSEVLGVLRIDYTYPPALGDVACPETFAYKTVQRMVDGLTFTMCMQGGLEGNTREAFVAAIKWLEDSGVSMIIGDCGFMLNYQKLARSITNIPVLLSSLLLLPTLLTTSSHTKAIAVFTASHANFAKPAMKDLVHRLSGLDQEEFERRIIMVGCEDVPGFEAVALGNAVDSLLVEKGVVRLARETLLEHPNLCAFLFECTELPPFSSAVRRATNLPVWDAITGANFIMAGCKNDGFLHSVDTKAGRQRSYSVQ